MDIKEFYENKKEKPLDRLVPDGGFAAIFRKIACVGDSLSSGEFETVKPGTENEKNYTDVFPQSWGNYMGRTLGSEIRNFSRGGMTTWEYCDSFAEANCMWDREKRADCYIIALGVNDMGAVQRGEHEVGTVDDIKDDCEENGKTFAGYYGKIIARYKKISPYAKFFLMTMPRETGMSEEREKLNSRHRELLYEIAERFDNCYVLDLYEYAPVYDEEFKKHFYLYGHLNPLGYALTAKMVMSYIDYIVRNNPRDFIGVGLIGSTEEDAIPTLPAE